MGSEGRPIESSMVTTKSEGPASLPVRFIEQEGNVVDPNVALVDNRRMINQLTGVIQETKRILQDQGAQNQQLQVEIARLHAQVPQATCNQSPILLKINIEEAI